MLAVFAIAQVEQSNCSFIVYAEASLIVILLYTLCT